MINLEKQLNRLPRKNMSLKADYLLRYKLHKAMWQKSIAIFTRTFDLKSYLYPGLATIVLLGLIVGVPGYAYASENVTATHYLYRIKKAVEKIELSLAFSAENKQAKIEKFTSRRLDEAEVLSRGASSRDDNSALIATINEAMNLRREIDQEEISAISKEEKGLGIVLQSVEHNDDNKADNAKKLNQIAGSVGIKAGAEVLDAVANALDEVKKAQPKLNENKNNNKKPAVLEQGNKNLNIKDENKIIEQAMDVAQSEIEKLNSDLNNDDYAPEDVQILNKHLAEKMEKARGAVVKKDIDTAKDIIKSTESLTNNAKNFLKVNKNNHNNR